MNKLCQYWTQYRSNANLHFLSTLILHTGLWGVYSLFQLSLGKDKLLLHDRAKTMRQWNELTFTHLTVQSCILSSLPCFWTAWGSCKSWRKPKKKRKGRIWKRHTDSLRQNQIPSHSEATVQATAPPRRPNITLTKLFVKDALHFFSPPKYDIFFISL